MTNLRIPVFAIFLYLSYGGHFSEAGVCDLDSNVNLPFCNPLLTIDERVTDLVGRIPNHEFGTLLVHNTSGSPTLGLDEYIWWNEALHGVAHSPGVIWEPPTEFSTSFPQVIHVASAFNYDLWARIATAISDEARAFHNVEHAGLTFWGPSVNIYRDPRWGRGHETPGEDPYLTSEYANVYIKGLQGAGAEQEANNGFLKTSACCKHYAVHSAETDRVSFKSIVNPRDLADTYLPAFKTCVQEGNVSCIMCAYNSVNGIPMCANKELMDGTLRDKWGFDGYITSDCGGVNLVQVGHNYTTTKPELMNAVLDAGLDLECEQEFFSKYVQVFPTYLTQALLDGTVTLAKVQRALSHLFRVQMRLGMFEKEGRRPYLELRPEIVVESEKHKQLAIEAARESIVLLKNDGNYLPLDNTTFNAGNKLALIGPHFNASRWFLANYRGFPSHIHTPYESIVNNYVEDTEYAFGCDITGSDSTDLPEALSLAAESTTGQIILFVGLNLDVEEEDNDRSNIIFSGLQNELIRGVLNVATKPVVLVLISGGGVDLTEYKNDPRVAAIVFGGYTGQAGGLAIADVLFGHYNPSGRLSQTFYSTEFTDQITIHDMAMRPDTMTGNPGRTYRFYTGQPVYEFGYGLTYSTFNYRWVDVLSAGQVKAINVKIGKKVDEDCILTLAINVTNAGVRSGDHSVLWFNAPPSAGSLQRPIKSLIHFTKLTNLQPGEQRQTDICLNEKEFQLANESGDFELIYGIWNLTVGTLNILLEVS